MKKFAFITTLILVWIIFYPFEIIHQSITSTISYCSAVKEAIIDTYNTPSKELFWFDNNKTDK